jgi:5-methylcytosine-specific restriction endonuclease McrA
MSALTRQTAYTWYLGTEFWQQKRLAVLERANYVCERCHKARATEVHHVTYIRVFNELATDLLAVCSKCHRLIHHHQPAANDNQLPFPIMDDG